MGCVGEDRQSSQQVRACYRAVHLPLVRSHFERGGDLAECPPALGNGVGHQLLDQLVFGHFGHPHGVDCKAYVLEVATGHYDSDFAPISDLVQSAYLLRSSPSGRRIDDAAEAVEGTGA